MSIHIHELENEDCVWVNSDDDPVGSKSYFTNKIPDKKERAMIALAEFLGYEPAELLNLDCCFDEQNTTQSEEEFRKFCEEYGYELLSFELGTNPLCQK